MVTTDPVADYLTRVRNAIQAGHKKVDIPASNLKRELSRILSEQKYINGYTEIADSKQGIIRISLKSSNGVSSIVGLKRISKPGRRMYVAVSDIPRVLNGMGIAVLSTSSGLMTDRQAREAKVGGEVLCYIW